MEGESGSIVIQQDARQREGGMVVIVDFNQKRVLHCGYIIDVTARVRVDFYWVVLVLADEEGRHHAHVVVERPRAVGVAEQDDAAGGEVEFRCVESYLDLGRGVGGIDSDARHAEWTVNVLVNVADERESDILADTVVGGVVAFRCDGVREDHPAPSDAVGKVVEQVATDAVRHRARLHVRAADVHDVDVSPARFNHLVHLLEEVRQVRHPGVEGERVAFIPHKWERVHGHGRLRRGGQ